MIFKKAASLVTEAETEVLFNFSLPIILNKQQLAAFFNDLPSDNTPSASQG